MVLDLIDAYGGKREVKKSLRTRDPQEALRLVRIASGEFEKDNCAHRARKQGQITPLTEAQIAGLALEWLEAAVRQDLISDIQDGPIDPADVEEIVENLREVLGGEEQQLTHGHYSDSGQRDLLIETFDGLPSDLRVSPANSQE